MSVIRWAAAAGLFLGAATAHAHIVLADPAALAGTSYRATLRVGHGCGVSPTTAIQVTLPPGFRGAKPMPKPGWALAIQKVRLDKPYDDHGRLVTEDVAVVTWTAQSRDAWLPDEWYDEFVLRGGLPPQAGPMWFKVLQTCAQGSNAWVETPASGTSTKGLKAPAALLEVIESGPVAHQH